MIAKHDYKILDDRVIAAYSLGQIVLPQSNNLDGLGFASSHLTYSISAELFGHDYRRQLPYHQLIILLTENSETLSSRQLKQGLRKGR
jgi:hypothetical protein